MKNKIHILILLLLAGQIVYAMEPAVEQLGITTDTKVELVSAQGRSFMLPEQCAQQSPVLRAILASSLQEGATKKIQLKNINTHALSVVSQLLQTQEGQQEVILNSLVLGQESKLAIELQQAAHYLDIEDLVTMRSPREITQLLSTALLSNIPIHCLQTLQGHTGAIWRLVVDGDSIISGSSDKTIKIWDKNTGNCIQTLQGHTAVIWCLVVDGDKIISGSRDNTIKIWDKNTGNCVQTLQGHAGWVECLVVDGDSIISGSRDNTIKIWDKNTGNCIQTLQGHTDVIACLVVDRDKIISGSDDKTIKIWDKNTGSCLQTLQGHTDTIWCLVVDGDSIISGSWDKTIKIWDKHTGNCIQTLRGHTYRVECLVVDGGRIISGSWDKTIKVWDKHAGNRLQTLQGHTYPIQYLVVDGDGIISGSSDNTIKIWDKNTGSCVQTLQGHTGATKVLVVDGDRIISGSWDKTIKIWDMAVQMQWSNFVAGKLPLPYAILLQQFNNAVVSGRSIILTERQQEILQHFLETIKDNWGDKAMTVIKDELLKLQAPAPWALQAACTLV
jgi:WD40 repeat protein